MNEYQIQHNLNNFNDLFSVKTAIDTFYDRFMTQTLRQYSENDLVSVCVEHSELNGQNIFIAPFHKKNYSKEMFFNALYEVAQSNKSFLIEGKLKIQVNVTKALHASGRTKAPVTLVEKLNSSRSVIVVNNRDNGCVFHAIVICIEKLCLSKDDPQRWQSIRRDTGNLRTKLAGELAALCSMSLDKEISISDLSEIQPYLSHQIVVIDNKDINNKLYIRP